MLFVLYLQLSVAVTELGALREVRIVLEQAKGGISFHTCVSLALRRFYLLYRDFILSLVRTSCCFCLVKVAPRFNLHRLVCCADGKGAC